ncbi:MAG: hypothetical protein L3J03_08440 [Desulfobacterales bacterium]|nr:hypothetical protein [Desulfobacterales bacterium]
MIHLTDITRPHGVRILFQNAGFQIPPNPGTGLAGPNSASQSGQESRTA